MKKVIKLLLVSVASVALLSACAEKPEAELGAATGAIDAVVSEGAEKYLPEAMQGINSKLAEAMTEIKAQDDATFSNYSAAKLTLSQVKEEADALKVKVAQRKEELKVAADAALSEAQAVVVEAKALLEVAPQGKGSLADIEVMKSDVVGLETELETVAPQIEAGEYIVATEKAHAVAARALMISNDVKMAQEKLAVVIKK